MRFIVDVNLSPKWVSLLLEAGIEASHWSSLGSGNALDSEIMAFAAHNDFCVITNDLDFGIMLSASRATEPSIVQLRLQDLRPEKVGSIVMAAILETIDELERGSLLTIHKDRYRIRSLPLNK